MEGSGVCLSLPVKCEVTEVPVDIKKEYQEEDDDHLMDTSRTESIDFGEKTHETNVNMMSTPSDKVCWIKNEFMEEPLNIKVETVIKPEPKDDSNVWIIKSDPFEDPLHTDTIVTTKSVKIGRMFPENATRKDKGESRYTSYILWCKEKRKELMSIHPDIDFAGISRELSKMWKTVSTTEKYNLKRRARRLTTKKAKTPKSNNEYSDLTTSVSYESLEKIKDDDPFRTKNEWLARQRFLDATIPIRGRPRDNPIGETILKQTLKMNEHSNAPSQSNQNRISLISGRIIKRPKCLS